MKHQIWAIHNVAALTFPQTTHSMNNHMLGKLMAPRILGVLGENQ
jgi:hypothetical protein